MIKIVPFFTYLTKKGLLLRCKGLLEALLTVFPSLKFIGNQLRAEWALIRTVAVILL